MARCKSSTGSVNPIATAAVGEPGRRGDSTRRLVHRKSGADQVITWSSRRALLHSQLINSAMLSWYARVQRGNKADFQILVERYQQRAFSVAWQILKRHEDAQDVVQEAFVKGLPLNRALFRGTSSFFTWFYRIVVNMAIDFRRKLGRTERETVSLDVETRDGIEQRADMRMITAPQNPLDITLRGRTGPAN